MSKLSWSHSRLDTYKTCPAMFYHKYVAKDAVQSEQHPTTLWGIKVHAAIEARIKEGTPLPPNMDAYRDRVELIANLPGIQAETRFGLDDAWGAAPYFGPTTRGRAIVDALWMTPCATEIGVWDWKLGKYRGDKGQANINAVHLFAAYPQVTTIRTQFVYFAANVTEDKVFTRDKFSEYVAPIATTVTRMNSHKAPTDWVRMPSGLCFYCEATACPFNKLGQRR